MLEIKLKIVSPPGWSCCQGLVWGLQMLVHPQHMAMLVEWVVIGHFLLSFSCICIHCRRGWGVMTWEYWNLVLFIIKDKEEFSCEYLLYFIFCNKNWFRFLIPPAPFSLGRKKWGQVVVSVVLYWHWKLEVRGYHCTNYVFI